VKSLLNYIPGNKNLVMWAAPSAPILAPILAPIVHGSDHSISALLAAKEKR
jgi:hypothetical protein